MSEQLQFVIDQIKAIKDPKFVLLIGIPGCGKTWFADRLANDFVLCSTDYFDPRYYRKGQMLERLDAQVRNATVLRRNILVDQTSLTKIQRESRLLAVAPSYTKIAVDLNGIEIERAIERVTARVRKVPEMIIRNLAATYQAPSL